MFNLDKFLSFAGPRVYLQSLTNSLMAWLMSGAPSALVTALWKSASWARVAAPDIAREGELVAVLGLPGLCQEVAPPVPVP